MGLSLHNSLRKRAPYFTDKKDNTNFINFTRRPKNQRSKVWNKEDPTLESWSCQGNDRVQRAQAGTLLEFNSLTGSGEFFGSHT